MDMPFAVISISMQISMGHPTKCGMLFSHVRIRLPSAVPERAGDTMHIILPKGYQSVKMVGPRNRFLTKTALVATMILGSSDKSCDKVTSL